MSDNKTALAKWFARSLDEFKRTVAVLYHTTESNAACCVGLPGRQQAGGKQ